MVKETESIGVNAYSELTRQGGNYRLFVLAFCNSLVETLNKIHNTLYEVQNKAIESDKHADTLNQYSNLIPINLKSTLSRRPAKVGTATTTSPEALTSPGKANPTIGKGKGKEAVHYEDATEKKLHDNVHQIGETLDSLNLIATGMNMEISRQEEVIKDSEKITKNASKILTSADKKTKEFLKK